MTLDNVYLWHDYLCSTATRSGNSPHHLQTTQRTFYFNICKHWGHGCAGACQWQQTSAICFRNDSPSRLHGAPQGGIADNGYLHGIGRCTRLHRRVHRRICYTSVGSDFYRGTCAGRLVTMTYSAEEPFLHEYNVFEDKEHVRQKAYDYAVALMFACLFPVMRYVLDRTLLEVRAGTGAGSRRCGQGCQPAGAWRSRV